MCDIYSSWDKFFKKAGDPMRIVVGDSCKSHFTAIAKAKVSSRTCFARIGESCTSLTQYLDTDHMHVFKHHYSNIFSTQVEPKLKGRKICARERRILVTRIVAQAHALTLQSTQRKRHDAFRKLGYLPGAANGISLRALPSYQYSPMSDIELKVRRMIEESQREEPQPAAPVVVNVPAVQLSIKSFFKKS